MDKNNLFFTLPSSQLFPFVGKQKALGDKGDAIEFAEKAILEVESKNFEKALKIYQEAIEKFPKQPFFYACRSMLYKILGDEESAFYDYQIAKRYDFNYHAFLEWCENAGAMEEDHDLEEISTKLITDHQNGQLYINRAVLQVQHFNYEEAVLDYIKAFELTNNQEILVSMAAVQMRMLRYDEALRNLDEVISNNNNSGTAYVYRAKLFAAIREYAKATEDFNQAVALNSSDMSILEERAQFYEQLQNWDAALADYSVIIRQNPDDFFTYVMRADVYEKLSNLKFAIQDYDKAIALNPYYSDLYQYRGDLRAQLGDAKGAAEDFEKFEELEADD